MQLLGELAVMVGAVGYASGYVYARQNVTGKPMITEPGGGMRVASPLENSAAQSLLALPMIGVAAVVLEHPTAACWRCRPRPPRGSRCSGWA